MPETLLSPSTILLYGRELEDLKLEFTPLPDTPEKKNKDSPPPRMSANDFLQDQLGAFEKDSKRSPRFARIYGYSYEGHYYDLARPTIMLVHGPGTDPEGPRPPAVPRVSRAPADVDRTGVAGMAGSYSEDIQVWSYDKADFSIRLDPDSGPLEQILLETELATEELQASYSGAHARVSGAHARVSGAHARISGAHARVRGRMPEFAATAEETGATRIETVRLVAPSA